MRAPVYSGKNGPIQLPRPPQPTIPTSTAELACIPNTVSGFRIMIPAPVALRKFLRWLIVLGTSVSGMFGWII
jgi:hypothetical protein